MRRPAGAVLPDDERCDGFADVRLDEGGGLLLLGSADLADHHDGFGLRVVVEHGEHVHERRAGDGVAADADAGGLPDAAFRQLVDGLVGEVPLRETTPTLPAMWMLPGMMPTLVFAPRGDEARAVGAQEPRLLPFQVAHHHRRIAYGDALRDADDERYAGVSGFEDGVGGERRRHEDERDVRAGLGDGLLHAVEDRNLVHEAFAALAGGNARDEVGAVGHAALGVEAALAPGDAPAPAGACSRSPECSLLLRCLFHLCPR